MFWRRVIQDVVRVETAVRVRELQVVRYCQTNSKAHVRLQHQL
jgi:hypothetical protein